MVQCTVMEWLFDLGVNELMKYRRTLLKLVASRDNTNTADRFLNCTFYLKFPKHCDIHKFFFL